MFKSESRPRTVFKFGSSRNSPENGEREPTVFMVFYLFQYLPLHTTIRLGAAVPDHTRAHSP